MLGDKTVRDLAMTAVRQELGDQIRAQPEPPTDAWIIGQLALCAKTTLGPWHIGERGGPAGPFHSLVTTTGRVVAMMIDATADAQAMAAAHNSYPLVLKELQGLRASFALYSEAVQAGMELYREAHPDLGELTDPDTGELVRWLIDEVRKLRRMAQGWW